MLVSLFRRKLWFSYLALPVLFYAVDVDIDLLIVEAELADAVTNL